AGVEAPGRTEIQAGAQGGPLLEEGRWLRRASLLGSRADTRIVARMHLRIFGFSASLVLLAALGWVLVQTPTPYGEPVEPEPEEEDLLAEEDAEEVDVEELRRQAEDAQRRVAEHLEAARRAQEEALRAQRQAGIVLQEEELPEEVEEDVEPPTTLEDLARRVEELETRLAEMQAMNEISDEQIAALEDELDALEERGEF